MPSTVNVHSASCSIPPLYNHWQALDKMCILIVVLRLPAFVFNKGSGFGTKALWSPRFEIGSALNHAPDSFTESALMRARERSPGALLNNEWNLLSEANASYDFWICSWRGDCTGCSYIFLHRTMVLSRLGLYRCRDRGGEICWVRSNWGSSRGYKGKRRKLHCTPNF